MSVPSQPDYDLAVVGAGPAGLAAAVAAAEHGLRVALIDAGHQTGGQFWRHPNEATTGHDADGGGSSPRPGEEGHGQHLWSRFTDLRERLGVVRERSERLSHHCGRNVWLIEPVRSGYRLHLTPKDSDLGEPYPGPAPSRVIARSVVLCPGGYDRQLPIPGWDLPGVMAAGGVQALMKASRTVAGTRVVVAGTGPFLLPVAAGLAEAGATVVAVCEAGSPIGWARTPWGAAAWPAKALEAAEYAARFIRHRIPLRTRTVVTEILGDRQVEKVRLGRLDRSGRLVGDRAGEEVEVDLVATGWGFTPSMELMVSLGCATRVDTDQSLVTVVDAHQRTDVAGVYAAGEATGVGGAALALAEGELAGLTAARDAGRPVEPAAARRLRRRIGRGRAFARAMHRAHPIPTGWRDWLSAETVLCRCEEVTVGEVAAVCEELGATDARTVKMLARPGMGWCQGRVCGFATACLLSPGGRAPAAADLVSASKRTLAAPIALADLAALDDLDDLDGGPEDLGPP